MTKGLSINVPLVKALEQMPDYSKFMKDLVTKKRSMNFETIKVTHQVSVIVHSIAPKLDDLGAFTISCTIGSADFAKALCDPGVSINLMPYSVFKTLGIGKPKPIFMRLKMTDCTIKRPLVVIEDILVRVDKFILPVDFVILDCEIDYEVSIILGRTFLATGKALRDVETEELNFWVSDEQVVFHVCKSMCQPKSNEVCSFVDLVTDFIIDDTSATINVGDMLEAVLLNFDDDEMDGFMECVNSLQGMGSYNYAPLKLSLDLENRKTPPKKPSIEEPPTLELKPFPPHIRKKAIGWTLADIRGISPTFYMHKIKLENGAKPSIEHKRRLNEAMQEDAKFHFSDDCMRAFEQLKLKLTTIPTITSPNYRFTFELMCDASDVAVGVVLGQHVKSIFHSVYYASNTMNSSQVNYTVIEKELLAIMFAIEKFRPYLMGAKVIVHSDHAALRYLMTKKKSKARLMRWVILLQEFDIDIQDKKGSENQMADHLSRLEEEGRPYDGLEINDSFPDEQLLALSMKEDRQFDGLHLFAFGARCCEMVSKKRLSGMMVYCNFRDGSGFKTALLVVKYEKGHGGLCIVVVELLADQVRVAENE
ncbi:uncharacterized protein [Nicotiana tomentosiformis]|uniref:uncharacterized protein n=1 Tax=Nicotiana tomentosiformis TaxID=4098 RepID=UPI00388C4DF5